METKKALYLVFALCIMSSDFLLTAAQFGHKKGHHDGLEMLLAAGILAKLLRKKKHHHHHHGHHHGHHHHGRHAPEAAASHLAHGPHMPPPPPPMMHPHPVHHQPHPAHDHHQMHAYRHPQAPAPYQTHHRPAATGTTSFSSSLEPFHPSYMNVAQSMQQVAYTPFTLGYRPLPAFGPPQ